MRDRISDPVMGFGRYLQECGNPACERCTAGAMYCCAQCGRAADMKYEIHDAGMLAHDPICEANWERRKGVWTRGKRR